MKTTINRWRRAAVSKDGRACNCIAGQFREDVLRFRFHDNASISTAEARVRNMIAISVWVDGRNTARSL